MSRICYILLLSVIFISCKDVDPWGNNVDGNYPTFPEVPTKITNNNFVYTTHYGTLNGDKVRNFTICFDVTKYAACWVAYPLHKTYRGSVERSYKSSEVCHSFGFPTGERHIVFLCKIKDILRHCVVIVLNHILFIKKSC